jgi:hypothetical protein
MMIPYPTKKVVPSRMTRKHDRNKVFIQNKKASKLRRKLQRRNRAELESTGA